MSKDNARWRETRTGQAESLRLADWYRTVVESTQTLLETLKREKLVLDWHKKQQAKANVQVTIGEILDRLPASYTKEVYAQLCIDVFQHVYESYFGQGKSVYAMAS